MRTPEKSECMKILAQHGLPKNIIAHSLAVANLAQEIAEKLKEKGAAVDVDLVVAGAILHDIAKLLPEHMQEGAKILREMSFFRVADVVERHGIRTTSDENLPQTLEDKIVYYADKRVVEDKTVTLEERFDYLAKTYPKTFTPRGEVYQYTKKIEQQLLN
jgi:putative nucleotidyltransferase with HDIG domain